VAIVMLAKSTVLPWNMLLCCMYHIPNYADQGPLKLQRF